MNFEVLSRDASVTHRLVLDADARELYIKGGGAAGDALVLSPDTNDVTFNSITTVLGNGTLPSTLTKIDVSGYDGAVTATMRSGTTSDTTGTDVEVVVGAGNLTFTMSSGNTADINYITTFTFTDGSSDSTWTISNFIAEGKAGASVANFSVLDFNGLGIADVTGLTLTTSGGNTTITSNTFGDDWQIVLIGVTDVQLGAANFEF